MIFPVFDLTHYLQSQAHPILHPIPHVLQAFGRTRSNQRRWTLRFSQRLSSPGAHQYLLLARTSPLQPRSSHFASQSPHLHANCSRQCAVLDALSLSPFCSITFRFRDETRTITEAEGLPPLFQKPGLLGRNKAGKTQGDRRC